MVRAPPCHGGGHGFEPHSGRHFPINRIQLHRFGYRRPCQSWGLSSAGRASALQAEGHRFEPCRPHSHYMDGFPSGQRGQTVNLLATLSVVRIHLHPFGESHGSIKLQCRGVEQLEARRAHNPEVVGSNPSPAIMPR